VVDDSPCLSIPENGIHIRRDHTVPRNARVLLSIVASVVLLAGICGCDNGGPSVDPNTSTSVEMIVGQREVTHLNVNYDLEIIAPYILPNIQDKLVEINGEYDIIPGLARSWEISPDGLRYTFHLAESVRWHDGHDFTSEDVKWTIQSVIEEQGVAAKLLTGVTSIETPDRNTVVITLSEPDSTFLNSLGTYYGFFILPKHLYEGSDVRTNEYNMKPVGTGPFIFKEWVQGSHITLVANDDYFQGRPKVDSLVFRFADHVPVVLAALESGEMHTSQLAVAFGEIPRLQNTGVLDVEMQPGTNPIWMGFNLTKAPFDDVRVRRAIAHAIDRKALSDVVFQGLSPAHETTYCESIAWVVNEDAHQPEYDLEKAAQLLDEAGLPLVNGVRLRTTVSCFRGTSLWGMPEAAEFIKEQLSQVGIITEIKLMEYATWTEVVNERHEFDMAIAGGLRGPNPQDFTNFVADGGARNCMQYVNPRVEQLFRDVKLAVDRDEVAAMYKEIQAIVAEDLPLLTLVMNVDPRVSRKEFTGFYWQENAKKLVPTHSFRLVEKVK
jgi:peptide/nickel transport system substrate-binding protein